MYICGHKLYAMNKTCLIKFRIDEVLSERVNAKIKKGGLSDYMRNLIERDLGETGTDSVDDYIPIEVKEVPKEVVKEKVTKKASKAKEAIKETLSSFGGSGRTAMFRRASNAPVEKKADSRLMVVGGELSSDRIAAMVKGGFKSVIVPKPWDAKLSAEEEKQERLDKARASLANDVIGGPGNGKLDDDPDNLFG